MGVQSDVTRPDRLQMDDPNELDAFFHFFATFALSCPLASPADFSDGAALSDVLAIVFVPSP